jgi:HD-GYP domain-containing protein (c-di-GMP phosphodiesterase class II)
MSVAKPTIAESRAASEFAEKLESVFAESFDVWRCRDGNWECTSGSGCNAQFEEIDRRQQPAGIGFFQPTVMQTGAQTYFVSVPYQTASECLIGFATVPADSDRYLLPLAKAVQSELRHSQEIDQLCRQTNQVAAQLSRNLEQLAFLRQMADRLELSTHRTVREVIEHFVPLLPTSIDCQWSAFVGTSDLRSRLDCACEEQNTIIGAGTGETADAVMIRLIAMFGNEAMSQPLVRNTVSQEEFPGIRQIILARVFKRERHWGWLLAANRNRDSRGLNSSLNCLEFDTNDASIVNTAAIILASHAHNVELIQQKENLVVNVVRTLVTAIEAKDPYTRGHSERVAMVGCLLAQELGLGESAMDRIYLTGLLHDIGKIGVPDSALHKPGALTREEFEQIKLHPQIGWQMLQGLDPLKPVLPGVLHHHERVDGDGYPDGLVGEEIPLDGRVLAVADAYDAMTSRRSHREGLRQEQAEQILHDGAGIQWDAKIIEALFAIMPEVIKIQQTYRKQSVRARRRSKRKID